MNPPPSGEAVNPDLRPSLSPEGWKVPRKVWTMGLAGLSAWLLQAGLSGAFGLDLGAWLQPWINFLYPFFFSGPPPSSQGAMAILFSLLFGYFIPASYRDIYNRINSKVIAHAVMDDSKLGVSIPAIVSEVSALSVAEASRAAKGR